MQDTSITLTSSEDRMKRGGESTQRVTGRQSLSLQNCSTVRDDILHVMGTIGTGDDR
jgi:hypothetical protein